MNYASKALRTVTRVAAAAFILVVSSRPVEAQNPTAEALVELRSAHLHAVSRLQDPAHKEALAGIDRALRRLEDRWIQANGPDLDSGYVDVLRFHAVLVRSASGTVIPDTALAILRDVEEDLTYKAAEMSTGVGWTVPAARSGIEITVRAVRNGQNARGYLVRANPRRYPGTHNAVFNFNNQAPTTKRLPAGNYVMWLVHEQTGQIAQKRDVTISSIDEPIITFELP